MKTPMSSDTKLTKDKECESVDSTKYRGMIGSLLYLTTSRLDIMFSVCLCARFQEAPKTSHLEAVKRIFRYIKGTTHLGLWYPKLTGIETIVYADSDHAGDYVDRKSTSGTDIQKESQKRPNQARDGKDKVKSKPKSVKVRKSTQTKSKVNQVKKIQLEGLKLPNLKLYYKNNKTRAEIEICNEVIRDEGPKLSTYPKPSFPPNKTQEQLTGPLHLLFPATYHHGLKHFHSPLFPQLYNCHRWHPSPFFK
ncbi:hypothetical protein Tco_0936417 [Tanacetum coccineum]